MDRNKRFSILTYTSQRGVRELDGRMGQGNVHLEEQITSPHLRTPKLSFPQMIEEARSFLSTTTGKSEEDKRRHSELLNRAILGFPEERKVILALIDDWITKKRWQHLTPPHSQFKSMSEAIFAEVIGLGVLELVLEDRDGLEEIQVIGKRIYEVRCGRPILSSHQFQSVKEVEQIQQNLVLFNEDTLNPRKKWAEVRLSDGSRVTLTGFGYTSEPTLTIRFYVVRHNNLAELCNDKLETMNEDLRTLLLCIIQSYFNLVIIGPTNSGKTHLMKALIAEMPDDERIVTIESRFELMLRRDFPHKNIVEYECGEEDEIHTGRQAFKLALRQSPKRICLAEIRDEEANLYVRACTRGHEGSMTTVHVSQMEDVPEAITDMCMLDGRGMDSGRLMKRITQFVTQIGIEMAVVEGQRKIVRMGEFYFRDGEAFVLDWAWFDVGNKQWKYSNVISSTAAARMKKYDQAGWIKLKEMGFFKEEFSI